MGLNKYDKIRKKKYDKAVKGIWESLKGLKVIEIIALLEEIKIDVIMNKVVTISGEVGTDRKKIKI